MVLVVLSSLLAGCAGIPDSPSGDLDGDTRTGEGVPYLQQGVDAARTGATTDPGPETFDLAFRLNLPGTRWREVVPVILEDAVYVLTAEETSGIWRINLDTGREELIVDFTDVENYWMSTFFSDGQRLFVGGGNEISAFSTDGDPVWTYTFPQATTMPPRATNCMPGSHVDGMLYLGCMQVWEPVATPSVLNTTLEVRPDTAVVAVALEAETGEEVWRSVLYPDPEAPEGVEHHGPTYLLVRTAVGPDHLFVQGVKRVLSAPALSLEAQPERMSRHLIWAFDRQSGALKWNWTVPAHSGDPDALVDPESVERDTVEFVDMGMVATADALFLKADRLYALAPVSGQTLWDLPLHQEGDSPEPGYALAFFDDDLYVTSHAHLYRVDADAQAIDWSVRAAPGDHWDDTLGLLVANGAVYGVTDQGRLSVYDIENGALLHQHRIGPEQTFTGAYTVAVGQEVVVASRLDGELLVIGRPPAAIQPSVSTSSTYPAPREPVTIDLSGTLPGALADDLEYQVNWGDGTLTDWQADPVFTHAYLRAEDRTATARMRNGAGQDASGTVEFHVGGERPRSPTLLETAFARDNQDFTFGVLGIVVALGGGIIALGWRQTRRSRLQRELTAIERVYEATKDDSGGCEEALLQRKAHCRGLLVDGRLEESQFAVLQNRIDELTRTLRVTALDDRFDFLPHGLVKALKDMLSDGQISAWERDHVMRAVDEDPVLTKRQKQKVRSQVDRWFKRDEGVTG